MLQGISKKNIIDKLNKLIDNLKLQGFQISEEKQKHFLEFNENFSRVLMFGLLDIDNLNLSYKTSIYRAFDTGFNGLKEMFEKEATNRNYKDFSNFVLEKFKYVEQYYLRALADIPSSEVEDKYLVVIASLEQFLQDTFDKELVDLLTGIETEIKTELAKIYNDKNLTEDEAILKANDYLDKKQLEATKLFEGKIQDKLNNEAIKQYLSVAVLLGIDKLTDEQIARQRKSSQYQYNSNIGAYFFNSFRRVKEIFTENILNGTNTRSLATDQLEKMTFNKNVFKLSIITHPRALFRGLVANSSKTETFKAIVPSFVLPTLNPTGITSQNLYLIKTKGDWAKTNGVENINVVDGLGLHHGSQEYYLPIFDLEKETELAKNQRQEFLKSI